MKILVADDDPLTLEAVCACLTDEGFSPIPATQGEEALVLWRQHRPALLCLDIMMPRMDGFEVCRRIRALDVQVPILFLSAKNEEIDIVVGLEMGADDFIRKPFGKRELLARVRAALRRRAALNRRDGPDALIMHDLTVYPEELRFVRAGQSIDLSVREVAILKMLHSHAGKPVHRDAFLDQCWGLDHYPESRTLDQHIAQLRRKVEADPARPLIIETIRGIGYRYREAGKLES